MILEIPDNILKGTISGKKNKEQAYEKIKIQLIKIKDNSLLQFSLYTEKQVFHKNYEEVQAKEYICELMNDFSNLELFTNDYSYSYRITSKGKVLSNRKKLVHESLINIDHNRKKNYLLEEGMIIPPLIDLGVMTSDGYVVKAHYDKYRQINRFLEIIDDNISNEKKLNIIDFGCGKSYLTFVLYYYLCFIKKIDCNIIGLDLKKDVVENCNAIAKKYGYKSLKFMCGDIAQYSSESNIDMIITLHACDTATDYALYHAILMKVKYIFSVPCCQKEINKQLGSDKLHLMNKYGIIKERFSALATDSIRANILEYFGYKTQIMEFVDIENSPKNLLIRATLTLKSGNEALKKEIEDMIDFLDVEHTLYKLIKRNM